MKAAVVCWVLPLILSLGAPLQPAVGFQGAGIFDTDEGREFTLRIGTPGWYYLGVAADPQAEVTAQLFNGTTSVDKAASYWGVRRLELAAGDYLLKLNGSGRAAVAWDFQAAGRQEFSPTGRTVLFLLPQGNNRLTLSVDPRATGPLLVEVLDAFMLRVYQGSFSSWQNLTMDLAADRADAAYVVVDSPAGSPAGPFSIAWSAGPAPRPYPILEIGIAVAALAATGGLVYVLGRRRAEGRRR